MRKNLSFSLFVLIFLDAGHASETNRELVNGLVYELENIEDRLVTTLDDGSFSSGVHFTFSNGGAYHLHDVSRDGQSICRFILNGTRREEGSRSYYDFTCNGTIDMVREKEGEDDWRQLPLISGNEYTEILSAYDSMYRAFEEEGEYQFDDRFILIPGESGVNDSHEYMMNLISTLEDINGGRERSLHAFYTRYSGGFHLFWADYDEEGHTYRNCKVMYTPEAREVEDYYLDRNCDGYFELYSDDGEMYREPSDGRIVSTVMMKDYLYEISLYAQVERRFLNIMSRWE